MPPKATPKVPTAEELEKKAAEEKAALDAAVAANASAAAGSETTKEGAVEGSADNSELLRREDGSRILPAGVRKVPTLEEVIAAGYTPEGAQSIVERETQYAMEEAAAPPIETLPAPASSPAPVVRHKVRADQSFYWVQGPGLPGVIVGAGEEFLLEQSEIQDLVARGSKLTILDANFRARTIAILERLPSHMVDPAPFSEGLAEVERKLAEFVEQILAFEKSKGSGG